jgi:hypothetical protein
MIKRSTIILSVLALPLFATLAKAGPCTQQIYEFDLALNKKLDAAAAAGRSGTETTAATAHRQPTLRSVEQAEAQLGDISPANEQAFSKAMEEARKADDANNLAGCEKALREARSMLSE